MLYKSLWQNLYSCSECQNKCLTNNNVNWADTINIYKKWLILSINKCWDLKARDFSDAYLEIVDNTYWKRVSFLLINPQQGKLDANKQLPKLELLPSEIVSINIKYFLEWKRLQKNAESSINILRILSNRNCVTSVWKTKFFVQKFSVLEGIYKKEGDKRILSEWKDKYFLFSLNELKEIDITKKDFVEFIGQTHFDKIWVHRSKGLDSNRKYQYNLKYDINSFLNYGEDWYNEMWFDRDWYDKDGFNTRWIHKLTWTRFNPDWIDKNWYSRYWYEKNDKIEFAKNQEYVSRQGYWVHEAEIHEYDDYWYDEYWYDKNWFDSNWLNRSWYDKFWYNKDWYDKYWFNVEGFNRQGIHKSTWTRFDPDGYDCNWNRFNYWDDWSDSDDNPKSNPLDWYYFPTSD